MVYKEILFITTLIVHCFICISSSEVVQQTETGAAGVADKKLYDFKNKEILQQNEIPELAPVKPIIEQKYGSLRGFIDAWDAIDHDRLRLSEGESFIKLLEKNKYEKRLRINRFC